jgi:hypothetical protein
MSAEKQLKECYFFVDEAGDPVFYNRKGDYIVGREGCSTILLMGFIKTTKPKELRQAILTLQQEVIADEFLQSIPSLKKTAIAFHAKDDAPEVREKVFKLLKQLDFSYHCIVARKIEDTFKRRHKSKESIFYNDLVSKLFENPLHKNNVNYIYYATRGSRVRQEPIENAIQVAQNTFSKKWGAPDEHQVIVYPQTPSGESCLQIVDYMNWAVQRAFQRGEDRYLNFMLEKMSYLVDLYDFDKYPKNYYNRANPFSLNKISPLVLGPEGRTA